MEREFWLDRWSRGEIGFHEFTTNPALEIHWPRVQASAGSRVLVPLCGKSLDMLWLAQAGHKVLGVELSSLAAEAFFAENQLSMERRHEHGYEVCASGNIEIWCGDFFALPQSVTADTAAVYDRASLIALPPDVQPAYARKLAELTSPGARVLLVAVEYDQAKMSGPPFSTPAERISDIFSPNFAVDLLTKQDTLGPDHRFRERGLDWMNGTVHVLQRLPSNGRDASDPS